ncbi:acyl-CoA dehydrogenase [Lysinibacillus sp. 2017]|uniref:acyl-CoA dehydrogenase family protein n=1 Tax=unclassified Lysinibacillus TaxID=2636778 RepID=UPI000D5262D0|nr:MULTISPECIES: acyl-CoA dehydrogenase family protein [unclassified Lysinibacillus]AWE06264.1 acyl-CoA dehydrogenase [Lysinibacillus sp. 2017]TGN35260.1 acyl-CoA dehydrogenase [Lysinibacillus sp. S2017]
MSKQLFIQTDEQRQWLEKLETLKESFTKNAQQIDEQSVFPFENFKKLREIGYTKMTLPKQYGGAGFTVYDAVLLHETLSSYCGSTGLAASWTIQNVGEIFENRYWDHDKLDWFGKEVGNGATVNRAVSEFAMGSPVRGGKPATSAKRDGDQYIINGRKNYTSGAPDLDYFLVSAWIEQDDHLGFFLVPKTAAGVSVENTWDVASMRGTGSDDLVLDNVRVELSNLVEIPSYSTGFKLNGWLLLIPATYLGIAQAARDYAVEFATTHSPNSIEGTIAQLPNVQSLIGEMDLALTNARFTIYGVAQLYNEPSKKAAIINEVNIAKHVVTNMAIEVVDKAMRLVGAKSLQRSNPLQRYYRDVRAGLHNPPMDDLTIKRLAETAIQDNLKQKEVLI